jgi:hypothetical protein
MLADLHFAESLSAKSDTSQKQKSPAEFAGLLYFLDLVSAFQWIALG